VQAPVIVLATAASTSSESKSILAHPVKAIFILALFAIGDAAMV
jgi:hypothetical protein